MPVAYRSTLSAQIFRVIGNSLKALGIFPTHKGGDDTNILTSGDLTCVVEDKITNENPMYFQQCKASEHTWDVTARGIVSENVTFVTIRVSDEFETPA